MPLAKILLAADGSEDAALASKAAADLSAKSGAELHVVYAWHLPGMVEPAPLPFALYEEDARKILAEELGRVAEYGAGTVEGHLKRDPPVDAILDLGEELGVDLIVVGSRGRGPVLRIALGSVSEGVAYLAARPVLVARGRRRVAALEGRRRRRVGPVATGGRTVVGLRHLFGAKTTLVRATEGLARPRALSKSEASLYERFLHEARAKHEEELSQRAKELARTAGTPIEIRPAEDDGATAILNACEEDPVTLAAVGVRG